MAVWIISINQVNEIIKAAIKLAPTKKSKKTYLRVMIVFSLS
jgi:hypothetical protein